MNGKKIKNIALDLGIDVIGGLLIAIGVYNFAVASNFPVSGISGIAVVLYHYFKIPIGLVTNLLNIPIILACYRLLGKEFLLKSIKTMIISNLALDMVAPLLPVYNGNLMLSAIGMGVFTGIGFAMIYARDTSTGGMDFVIMAVRKCKPHMSLGKLIVIFDFTVVLIGGLLLGGNIDNILYGLIAAYILSVVVDKAMYGIDAGKMAFIVTEHGQAVCDKIDEFTQRGSTILKGVGSYSKAEKEVVMCACNTKQMHMIQKAVKEVDKNAFLVCMESSEVRGEGFKPH